ncbi:D-alanine--poly(phosphoribitol) ligase subunit DltC [Vagococcus sp. PNs007]|uniref:D-alanyl carrier protein n=1 Tax=Vagococcus proximus TaxID=2991417 RepID=A0ABT5X0W7_9ENTE|nr:D-alanine--poly(phosphoribitol) ligase subunit DltC [Vagococcus proximus]MDF0479562.1 D-alanine--poly(phosphoribitol) ligase subunit DltC [Vagococcus proximus]
MDLTEQILDILEDLTGTDEVKEDLELDLFEEGLFDSLSAVQLLIELEEKCGKKVHVTKFKKAEWATPQKIIEKMSE